MNVPSSTSSSNQRLLRLAWVRVLGAGCTALLVCVITLELCLAALGYHTGLGNSYALWERQRARADALGTRALILVGNSRIQNDVDLDTLRRETGLDPVQLGIGGASFLPVLRSLAADSAVKGLVIVNFEADELAHAGRRDLAQTYVKQYASRPHGNVPDFLLVEGWLSDELHFHLRSYADGTRPLTALVLRILGNEHVRQFESLSPSRQVRIDFSKTDLPRYGLTRAVHEFGPGLRYQPGMSDAELQVTLDKKIAALDAADDSVFRENLGMVSALAAAIASHGGQTYFVVFPRSGYVRKIDDRRYPRALFWDRFAAQQDGRALNYEDVPALRDVVCPDGSHVDEHDQAGFTTALVSALHLGRGSP